MGVGGGLERGLLSQQGLSDVTTLPLCLTFLFELLPHKRFKVVGTSSVIISADSRADCSVIPLHKIVFSSMRNLTVFNIMRSHGTGSRHTPAVCNLN